MSHQGERLGHATTRSVLLVGYFQRGNLGDNAMLEGLVSHLESRLDDARISALPLPSVRQVPAIVGLLVACIRADVVVLAGGSHFHDKYGRKSIRLLLQLLVVFTAAKLGGATVIYAGIGIGPLETRLGRFVSGRLLRVAKLTVVRDEASLIEGRRVFVEGRFIQGADLALLLPTVPGSRASALRLGVSIVPFNALYSQDSAADVRMVECFAGALGRWMAQRPGSRVDVFVFCESQGYSDLEVSRLLVKRLENHDRVSLIRTQDATEMLERLGEVDIFVGARFHSILLAYSSGLPIVPIIYHEKCSALCDEIGLAEHHTISPAALTAGAQPDAILAALSETPELFRASLPLALARERAREAADEILRAITGEEQEAADEGSLGAALSGVRRSP